MNIYIRGEKLEITDAMKSYAKEKLERLSKYVKDSDVNANLLFKINGIKQKLEVTIPLKNFTLRVEEVGDDFYAVVDTAVDKLERQIRKNKTRLENKQVKSRIGAPADQKRTLDALGLRKLNRVVEHECTPSILGMVDKVKHLVAIVK